MEIPKVSLMLFFSFVSYLHEKIFSEEIFSYLNESFFIFLVFFKTFFMQWVCTIVFFCSHHVHLNWKWLNGIHKCGPRFFHLKCLLQRKKNDRLLKWRGKMSLRLAFGLESRFTYPKNNNSSSVAYTPTDRNRKKRNQHSIPNSQQII